MNYGHKSGANEVGLLSFIWNDDCCFGQTALLVQFKNEKNLTIELIISAGAPCYSDDWVIIQLSLSRHPLA